MRKSVSPSEIQGTVTAPPSKSVMLRAVAAAVMSEGPVAIKNSSSCQDAEAALRIARSLGAGVERLGSTVIVRSGQEPPESVLDCGESGLCARMFAPIAALFPRPIQLTGRGSLLRRPLGPLEHPLSKLGADCVTRNGFLPILVKGPLIGGAAKIDASLGSQFLTGLLMSLPRAGLDSELTVERLTSVPYIELTLRVLEQFDVSVVHRNFRTFRIRGGQKYSKSEYRVEGDWSGAAFLFVAAALSGAVRVEGLDLDSRQGDRLILEALAGAGARVESTPAGIDVIGAPLRAFEFDAAQCPDLIPPLVPLAARAAGGSVIRGAERLIHKESNRAEALLREFRALGVDIRIEENCLLVRGGPIGGGVVDAHGDHRIAMALAVAALAADNPVTIEGAECVAKSYPRFFEELRDLGGKIDE